VPVDERGRPSFRLDRMAPANGCGAGNAHDAVADAEATLGLARVFKERAPALWRHLLDLTDRHRVRSLLADLPELALTDFVFGRSYSRLVCLCGENPLYPGEIALFDLAFRPEDFRGRSAEELAAAMRRSPKAILPLRTTTQPLLMPADVAPPDTPALRIPVAERRRRAGAVRGDAAFQQRVGEALARRFVTAAAGRHVEERLYERRFADAEEEAMAAFHAAPWAERPAIVAGFADPRLAELGRRLLWVERPELLGADDRAELMRWAAERVVGDDPDAPWRSLGTALRESEALLAGTGDDARAFLVEIRDFLESLAERWVAVP